jgi:hypothetical protein
LGFEPLGIVNLLNPINSTSIRNIYQKYIR